MKDEKKETLTENLKVLELKVKEDSIVLRS